jgi:hypothetical protein
MADRKMTIKGFIHKANGKIGATAFLAAHREYMLSEELAPITAPILVKIDKGEVMPTPGLEEIKQALFQHMMVSTANKGVERAQKVQAAGGEKPYLATVYDGEGKIATKKNDKGEVVELQKTFAMPQEAEGWTDRRLEEGEPDWRGEVVATHMNMITTHITREEALKRILRKKGGTTGGKAPSTSGGLSWGVKSKPSRATFSHG